VAVAEGRTTPSRGVSRFLAAHESCEGGFQVTRTGEPGSPKLRLLCQGCGQRAAYAAGDASLLGDLDADAMPGPGTPEKGQPASARRRRRARRVSRRFAPADVGAGQAVTAAQAHRAEEQPLPAPAAQADGGIERWLPTPPALPWWVPNLYILLIIAVGVGLIAFGVWREQDDGGGSGPAFRPAQPVRPAPSAPAAPQPVPVPAVPEGESAPPATAGRREGAAAKRVKRRLDRVTVAGRFSIGIPEGWSRGSTGNAVFTNAGDGEAEIRVFLQPGAEPLENLERKARRFLKSEHGGAKVAQPAPVRLGSVKGRELRAAFRGGTETAVVAVADGYSYLLLGRVDADAPAGRERLTLAALRSFRAS
jgi:hypothetical protein